MDLIDRGAAIEAMKKWATQPVIMKSRYFNSAGKAIVLDMIGTVEGQPTVPAVPLNKLCEWLAENALDIHKQRTTPYKQGAKNWETLIRGAMGKWMEGLDASD